MFVVEIKYGLKVYDFGSWFQLRIVIFLWFLEGKDDMIYVLWIHEAQAWFFFKNTNDCGVFKKYDQHLAVISSIWILCLSNDDDYITNSWDVNEAILLKCSMFGIRIQTICKAHK